MLGKGPWDVAKGLIQDLQAAGPHRAACADSHRGGEEETSSALRGRGQPFELGQRLGLPAMPESRLSSRRITSS